MVQVRDAQGSKGRILKAAFDAFTREGFAGARVDDIAARARCNKALIYQYFGDKEQLFKHVLECKLAELGSIAADRGDLAQKAGEFFDFHAKNPWLTRLMMWEALEHGARKRVPNEAERTQHYARHLRELEDAKRAGSVDPSLDAAQLLCTFIGLTTYWFAFPQAARMITGGDPNTPEALAARRAHIIEIIRRIVEVRT